MTASGIPVVPEVKILRRTSLQLTATAFGTWSGVIPIAFVKLTALLIKTVYRCHIVIGGVISCSVLHAKKVHVFQFSGGYHVLYDCIYEE
jgi:hypothetical protein